MKNFLGTLFVLLIFTVNCQKPEETMSESSILNFHGDVKVNGKEAKIGMKLTKNDQIETGAASFAEILFNSHRDIIRINANTSITLEKEEELHKVRVHKGWLAGIIKTQKVKFITPTVTAGVRGTTICLKVENPKSTYACTCNGTIHYQGSHDEGKEITAAHHKPFRYIEKDGKSQVISAGMEFHQDSDLEELASRLENYKINWNVPD